MKMTELEMENEIVHFVDDIKDLISLDVWENMLLDCSKNEVLILWLLYRQTEVNMSQVADYIHTPLNTATGIITRMEKKKLITRQRSELDKRVVTIQLAPKGQQQIKDLMKEISYYGLQLASAFSQEELELFFRMLNKVKEVMKQERRKENTGKKIRKITIE